MFGYFEIHAVFNGDPVELLEKCVKWTDSVNKYVGNNEISMLRK